ncbi:unnamed protein product [Hermetia illucens]|uniref:Peroxisomal membrane protein 2 n=1 Tax=Hermetia illucens TaxID=343691 RepID=A0A7R8UH79_HERIL|nr:PXMP2/4 family protein 3 [Hermetia illucens]XP_037905712.1 PXMP2/4 family protein 3 [Hermetia illucens]CAD7080833.1 unnamed protein product [Hermetia illucens]
MSLSKPVYNLLGVYFEQLFNHPIRTKSITSCVIATTANYTSQKIGGAKKVNKETLYAYGLYGLIFGGTIPHYFYMIVEKALRQDMKFRKLVFFLIERFLYAPLTQVVSLYVLSRFEGNNHKFAMNNLMKLYVPLLTLNWRYLSLPVFLNIYFVPPMLRVLISNIVGFAWVVFVATKRRKAAEAAKAAKGAEASTSKSS